MYIVCSRANNLKQKGLRCNKKNLIFIFFADSFKHPNVVCCKTLGNAERELWLPMGSSYPRWACGNPIHGTLYTDHTQDKLRAGAGTALLRGHRPSHSDITALGFVCSWCSGDDAVRLKATLVFPPPNQVVLQNGKKVIKKYTPSKEEKIGLHTNADTPGPHTHTHTHTHTVTHTHTHYICCSFSQLA